MVTLNPTYSYHGWWDRVEEGPKPGLDPPGAGEHVRGVEVLGLRGSQSMRASVMMLRAISGW